MSGCRVPSSTYRLQLTSTFTARHALELVPYLNALGIGAVYLSPILKARAGSGHGYDVVDHGQVNPELGTVDDFRELGKALRNAGMGLIVDIVPNHMCIADAANWRWWDVLENGPSSPQAQFFDIDWSAPRKDLADKVLVPVLGDQYGSVLEAGQLRLEYTEGAFSLAYWEKRFPVAPRTWLNVLAPIEATLAMELGDSHDQVNELRSIMTALSYLPLRTETDPLRISERQREKKIIKARIARLNAESSEFNASLESRLQVINGRPGVPESFNELEALLADQAYRLSYWRVAADEINYRRFFDVNELAAIRVENPVVFEAVHATILDGVREGWITGLRVDHPDGLYDPARYFTDLQRAAAAATGAQQWHDSKQPFYVVAEKIMGSEEQRRRNWAVHGTTGYGFLNEVNGLFVDPSSEVHLRSTYETFTGERSRLADLIYECKRLILRVSLSSELNVLTARLDRICQQHRQTRDFTLYSLRYALREVIAWFPVYRTYIAEAQRTVDPEDRRHILGAVEQAKECNPATSSTIFDAIASILLLDDPPGLTDEQISERRLFVMRFQQLTGPVMAKGVEDTAFYRQYPLASINEVGGDPLVFGLDPPAFHERTKARASQWPSNLLASSTHDTKRSEDVRARINVLSEIAGEWQAALNRWRDMNKHYKQIVDGEPAPDSNTEYLLYQTLIGTWPLAGAAAAAEAEYVGRIQAYMEKASREAKLHTSWINPDPAFDDALRTFVTNLLTPGNAFLQDIDRFSMGITTAGLLNALSQTVIKMMCPGVPDTYRGTELWDFSLVDPDNRRPVDFRTRQHLLSTLPGDGQDAAAWLSDAVHQMEDGRLKLFITSRLARLRHTGAGVLSTGRL